MRKNLIILVLAVALLVPVLARAEGGCDPEFRAVADNAVVELRGKGELKVVVVTDPLCYHCRLGHKLLGEYPDMYRSLKLSFFPRKSYIGSDMAAWILEDAVGTDKLEAMVDFAYTKLKKAKTTDIDEARMIMLAQFVEAFPHLIQGTNLADLYIRLAQTHMKHVLKSAELATAAKLPGTPILIAGSNVVVGYSPDAWLKSMEKAQICE